MVEVNKANVALKDLGGLKQQTLKLKKIGEEKAREELRDMMLKKIRD